MTSQNWLITGVSSGFGRELATQLLDQGETVIGTVRRPDSAADLLQKYPGTFRRELLDVTDVSAVQRTGSPPATRPGWPPPSSPAPASSPPRCA
jgi:NADP-dependent 3-hydroxy acid dehydrogenase YdfG